MRALIVGDCKLCDSQFCVQHRIPEAHACKGIALHREEISKKWVVISSELASVAGLVMGTLTPKDGFR
jgi:predicted nucleic acid binding AN1-type Zn finger protein